jgi:TonB family protein
VSGSKGHFSIEGLEKGDSLAIGCIGYSTGVYIIQSSVDIEIQLERQTYVPAKTGYLDWVILKADEKVLYKLIKEIKNDRTSTQVVRFDSDKIFMKVEMGPSFKGKLGSLDSLINLSIGKIKAKKNSAVTIGFVIDKNGMVSEAVVVKSAGTALDEKVVNFIKQNMSWLPAIQNGIRFSTYCELPFSVKTKDKQSHLKLIVQ